ncbi:MAG: hypothetical protein WC136_08350 [Sphaerochaeta sp.]|jgi:hypothetical protein
MHNLNNLTPLQLRKVEPRIHYHNYKTHKFYVYVYLNPFSPRVSYYDINGITYKFYFDPIYIGKASSRGFRHNQHIKEYLKSSKDYDRGIIIQNPIKKEAFQRLENNMMKVNNNPEQFDIALPRNWSEYQSWIMILEEYDTHEALVDGEKQFIKKIGTIKKNNGPLVNILLG